MRRLRERQPRPTLISLADWTIGESDAGAAGTTAPQWRCRSGRFERGRRRFVVRAPAPKLAEQPSAVATERSPSSSDARRRAPFAPAVVRSSTHNSRRRRRRPGARSRAASTATSGSCGPSPLHKRASGRRQREKESSGSEGGTAEIRREHQPCRAWGAAALPMHCPSLLPPEKVGIAPRWTIYQMRVRL